MLVPKSSVNWFASSVNATNSSQISGLASDLGSDALILKAIGVASDNSSIFFIDDIAIPSSKGICFFIIWPRIFVFSAIEDINFIRFITFGSLTPLCAHKIDALKTSNVNTKKTFFIQMSLRLRKYRYVFVILVRRQ